MTAAKQPPTWNPAVVRADLLAEVRTALAEMTAHRDATQIEYDEMRADRDGCRAALAAVGRQRNEARERVDATLADLVKVEGYLNATLRERDEARDHADRLRTELNHWQAVIVPELKAERDGLQLAAVATHDNTAALIGEIDRMRSVVEAAVAVAAENISTATNEGCRRWRALCMKAFDNLPKNTVVTYGDVDAILTWCLPNLAPLAAAVDAYRSDD